jgi:hypothetical protein
MRFTETIVTMSCDRCDKRINENDGIPAGWLFASTALSEAPTFVVRYELCPACRDDLGTFMKGGAPADRPLVERLADILYPMDEFADTQWNGADVCDALAEVLRDVAPWAAQRQPHGTHDAYEAYKRERERLGL